MRATFHTAFRHFMATPDAAAPLPMATRSNDLDIGASSDG